MVSHRGLQLSHPLQALLECSETLPLDDLVVMGDGIIRRKEPLATPEQLAAAIQCHTGRRGYGRLAAAHPLMRPLTDSARETMLRLLLERAGFPEPEVNGEICDERGFVIAHGDLVYRAFNTIVEHDGAQHREDARQFSVDVERLDRIMELGWRIIRVDKVLMNRRAIVLRKVDTALRSGGWNGFRPAAAAR